MDIWDHMRPIYHRFSNDAQRINWVSQHFNICDPRNPGYEMAAKSWFGGLLSQNAQALGKWS
ncbi:hypothetical protein CROQUDRAFT_650948 [Cronartium quercuum f. sp. fusiforme G11]|uniref:Uncharacterized protein n=1 Tax=Cronartium quercuum f. sp. fusiforme G11 TaxID=708437 RepID=A0A9P6NQJ8_9BASI|nr:hypothetical protein CROQUDRAFT_650948 [Cronartium quercuum f. sp. fusiforme G11]